MIFNYVNEALKVVTIFLKGREKKSNEIEMGGLELN